MVAQLGCLDADMRQVGLIQQLARELRAGERITIRRLAVFFHGVFDPNGRPDNQEHNKTDQ